MTLSTSVSPQMRVVALAGVLLVALAGASMLLLHHSNSGAETVLQSTPARTTHAATTPTRTTPATTVATHSSTPPASRPHAAAVDSRLPAPLRTELARHHVVVVAFFDPQVGVDGRALVEARAGAAAAGVGFLAVNVLDDSVAVPLTALLPPGQLLPDPGILVYRGSGKIVYRYDGYLDRAAIAQAADSVK